MTARRGAVTAQHARAGASEPAARHAQLARLAQPHAAGQALRRLSGERRNRARTAASWPPPCCTVPPGSTARSWGGWSSTTCSPAARSRRQVSRTPGGSAASWRGTVSYFAKPRGINVVFEGDPDADGTFDGQLVETAMLHMISNSLMEHDLRLHAHAQRRVLGAATRYSAWTTTEAVLSDESKLHAYDRGNLGLRYVGVVTALHKGSFLMEGRVGYGTHMRMVLPLRAREARRAEHQAGEDTAQRHGVHPDAALALAGQLRLRPAPSGLR